MFKIIAQDSISAEQLNDNSRILLKFCGISNEEIQNFDYSHIYKSNYLYEKFIEFQSIDSSAAKLEDNIENIFANGNINIGITTFSTRRRRNSSFFDDDDLPDEKQEILSPEEERTRNISQLKDQLRSWVMSEDIILPQEIQTKIANYDEAQIAAIKRLPWFTKENDKPMNLKEAESILNKNIFGLDEVKTQILQYIAAQINTESTIGTVLLFDGPPGIGKTSIAFAIAEAMHRKLYTIKIPAHEAAWEFCGLDTPWKGAKPGLIIDALISTQSASPVILLDEIDKIPTTQKDSGNISSALLTVLDSERSHYKDSFLQLEIDLSEVVFLATSNDINKINPVLLDRLKIIPLKGYTGEQKKKIAQAFIIPQKRKIYKLTEEDLIIEDEAVKLLVQQYAIEPGVRTLMHDLDSIFSYASKYKLDGQGKLSVDKEQIFKILGEPRVKSFSVGTVGGIGDCFSMNYYGINGRFDIVQATVYPGTGKIIRTGAVTNRELSESINVVMSHIKKFSLLYGIEYELIKSSDIHINMLSENINNGKEYALSIFVAVICAFKGWATESWVFLGRLTLNGTIIPPEQLSDKIASFILSEKVEKFITSKNEDFKDKEVLIPADKQVVYLDNAMDVFHWLKKALNKE